MEHSDKVVTCEIDPIPNSPKESASVVSEENIIVPSQDKTRIWIYMATFAITMCIILIVLSVVFIGLYYQENANHKDLQEEDEDLKLDIDNQSLKYIELNTTYALLKNDNEITNKTNIELMSARESEKQKMSNVREGVNNKVPVLGS